MNTFILILIFVGIPVVLFAGIILWIKSSKHAMYERGKELVEYYEDNFEKASPANAVVVSVENKKVMSDARGKVKVDLTLEILKPGNEKYIASTPWIIDVIAVSRIQPGETIAVRIDADDNNKIYPDVEWAGYWIYD